MTPTEGGGNMTPLDPTAPQTTPTTTTIFKKYRFFCENFRKNIIFFYKLSVFGQLRTRHDIFGKCPQKAFWGTI